MRRPHNAKMKAPGLAHDLRLELEEPGPCDGPLAAALQPGRCRSHQSRAEMADDDASAENGARRPVAKEDICGAGGLPPVAACVGGFDQLDEEALEPAAATPEEVAALRVRVDGARPVPAAPGSAPGAKDPAQPGQQRAREREPEEASAPEPEPQPQPALTAEAEQPARRWQSQQATASSRREEEEAMASATNHPPGVLVFTFKLPDGTQKKVDFAPGAMGGKQLGLDILRQGRSITVNGAKEGSTASELGVESGWIVTQINEESIEGRGSLYFQLLAKKLIDNLSRK